MYGYNRSQNFPKDYELKSSSFSGYMNKYYYKDIDLHPFYSDVDLEYHYKEDLIDIYSIFTDISNDNIPRKFDLIKNHIRLFNLYFKEGFRHTFVDISYVLGYNFENIKKMCNELNSNYIIFPIKKDIEKNVTEYIGVILNYLYNEIIKKRNFKYFGLLDSYIYLTKDIFVKYILDNNFCCGRTHSLDIQHWYIWYAFSFYNSSKFDNLDFCPKEKHLHCDMGPPYYSIGGRNHYLYFFEFIRRNVDITFGSMKWKKILSSVDDVDFNNLQVEEFNKLNDGYIEIYNNFLYFTNYYRKSMDYFNKLDMFANYISGVK